MGARCKRSATYGKPAKLGTRVSEGHCEPLVMCDMAAPLVKSVLDGAKQNKTELAENLAVVQVTT